MAVGRTCVPVRRKIYNNNNNNNNNHPQFDPGHVQQVASGSDYCLGLATCVATSYPNANTVAFFKPFGHLQPAGVEDS
ncbi:hypothetical protein CDV31_016871 [Fusarium ambrosium]|uniref:Uncharacterized protein n=1 Tax=Fusarium ambrosium TaxID=131363 RepID=A0A428S088_9HYPO|nr:hypothetical protein CDV31_016871 [Fusarium ambrosium]